MNVTLVTADLPVVTVHGPVVVVRPATFDLPLHAVSAVVAELLAATWRRRGLASFALRALTRVRDHDATIIARGAGVRVRVGSHGVLTLDEAGDLAARLTTAYNRRRGRAQ